MSVIPPSDQDPSHRINPNTDYLQKAGNLGSRAISAIRIAGSFTVHQIKGIWNKALTASSATFSNLKDRIISLQTGKKDKTTKQADNIIINRKPDRPPVPNKPLPPTPSKASSNTSNRPTRPLPPIPVKKDNDLDTPPSRPAPRRPQS